MREDPDKPRDHSWFDLLARAVDAVRRATRWLMQPVLQIRLGNAELLDRMEALEADVRDLRAQIAAMHEPAPMQTARVQEPPFVPTPDKWAVDLLAPKAAVAKEPEPVEPPKPSRPLPPIMRRATNRQRAITGGGCIHRLGAKAPTNADIMRMAELGGAP